MSLCGRLIGDLDIYMKLLLVLWPLLKQPCCVLILVIWVFSGRMSWFLRFLFFVKEIVLGWGGDLGELLTTARNCYHSRQHCFSLTPISSWKGEVLIVLMGLLRFMMSAFSCSSTQIIRIFFKFYIIRLIQGSQSSRPLRTRSFLILLVLIIKCGFSISTFILPRFLFSWK